MEKVATIRRAASHDARGIFKRPADAAYATVVTVMITFLPFWLSIPRYLLSMYPLFLLAGRIKSRWLYLSMVVLSFMALVVLALAFGRGYWAF